MASSPEKIGDALSAMRAEELAALMGRYGPALRRYFARKANAADAEDLVQEVFLRLQAKQGGDPIENIEGYLFKVAKHVLLNRNRQDRTDGLWRHFPLDEARSESDDISPERVLAGKQDVERLIIAILDLPPRARAAFEFHRFDKLSYSAIAVRMGISKAAVQKLMHRAIEKLGEEFGDEP